MEEDSVWWREHVSVVCRGLAESCTRVQERRHTVLLLAEALLLFNTPGADSQIW